MNRQIQLQLCDLVPWQDDEWENLQSRQGWITFSFMDINPLVISCKTSICNECISISNLELSFNILRWSSQDKKNISLQEKTSDATGFVCIYTVMVKSRTGLQNEMCINKCIQRFKLTQAACQSGEYGSKSFHPYWQIQSWMFEMNRTHPHLVDLFSIGQSYEGRPLYVLQVKAEGRDG